MTDGEIATALLDAHDRGVPIAPPSVGDSGFDVHRGYAVAAEVLRRRAARGELPVGRKIGFTNRNIWAQFGVDGPNWAHMYSSTVHTARDNVFDFSLAGTVAPLIEPEIAFKLARPLTDAGLEPARMLESVEWVARSYEIVDCPFPGWTFTAADAAAGSAFHHALILGEPRPLAGRDLTALARALGECKLTLLRDGATADQGVGANALGHPCAALAFLVSLLAKQPQFAPLAAGEIITTGTLTRALPIKRGETWRSETSGIDLPPLSVTFN